VLSLLRGLSSVIQSAGGDSHDERVGSASEATAVAPDIAPPERVGAYRIIRLLGAGGMGEVYEAEQDRPRRRVALKLMRSARLSPAKLRRFEYEAEWLGRLDHAGIARIYEAGSTPTPTGPIPYFAMELVSGQRLDRWIGESQPDLRARIRLLIELCHAVQHAHQKGLIHRDLKPANILVTPDGQPKILDFGVARAMGDESPLSDPRTLATADGTLVGTIQYMSPEQAGGDVRQLDTRSDVYSLGVIAYQMLSDRLPYDVGTLSLSKSLDAVQRIDPPRLGSIDRHLRGDLEIIVAKAMEKRKEDRYPSAAEMAGDFERYLTDQPISARAPGLWYQFRKFARRRKGLVAAAMIVLATLVAGIVGTTWGLYRAERARRVAETSNAISEQVNKFLQAMLSSADPARGVGRDVTVVYVLKQAEKELEGRFADQPLVEAAIRLTLADTCHELGMDEQAVVHYQRGFDLRKSVLGEQAMDTIVAATGLASTLVSLGRWSEAEPLMRRTLEAARVGLGNDDPQTISCLSNLGWCLHEAGRSAEGEPLLRDALERRRRISGDDHGETLKSLSNLALALQAQGKFDEAEVLGREQLRRMTAVTGPDHPYTILSMNNLATTLANLDRWEEAEKLLSQALEKSRRVLGEDHPETMTNLANLAFVMSRQGHVADAVPLAQEALERRRRVNGDDHPQTIAAMNNLADLFDTLNRMDEAEALFAEALARSRRSSGDRHPRTLLMMTNLAYVRQRQKRDDQALPLFREAFELTRQGDPSIPTIDAAQYAAHYGYCLIRLNRFAEAEEPLLRASELMKQAKLDQDPRHRAMLQALAKVCSATNRAPEAAAWRARADAIRAEPRASATVAAATQPAP
jgi:tetratricopeptide (TPR) repeat protein